ncbi:hypothetical protein EMIT0P265_70338 [Pseudomonas zeae]
MYLYIAIYDRPEIKPQEHTKNTRINFHPNYNKQTSYHKHPAPCIALCIAPLDISCKSIASGHGKT